MPVAGVDYPRTFQQFTTWFHDDEACREYLARLRWPNGFVCPACGAVEFWMTGAGLWMCRSCQRRTSVTAGTIMHRSRLPLTTWFSNGVTTRVGGPGAQSGTEAVTVVGSATSVAATAAWGGASSAPGSLGCANTALPVAITVMTRTCLQRGDLID